MYEKHWILKLGVELHIFGILNCTEKKQKNVSVFFFFNNYDCQYFIQSDEKSEDN